jgi:hypothetical protein
MAIRNFIGFEGGSSIEDLISVLGNDTYVTDDKHSGDYAMKITHPGSGNSGLRIGLIHETNGTSGASALNTHYGVLYFKYSALPTGSTFNLFYLLTSANAILMRFGISTTGKIFLQGSTSADTGLQTTPNQWHRMEWFQNGSGGACAIRLDGVDGVLTATATAGDIARGQIGNAASATVMNVWYDDFALSDSDWIGPVSIWRLDPNGAGASTAWTGTYEDVDEAPNDGDTTYITSSVSGETETVQCETLESSTGSAAFAEAAGAEILAVKTHAVVRDEGGAALVQVRLTADGVSDDTVSNDPGATYADRSKVYNQTPNTTNWTEALLDGAEVGVDNAASVAIRCTRLFLTVLVVGSMMYVGPTDADLALASGTTYSGEYGNSYAGSGTLGLNASATYSHRPVDQRFVLRADTNRPTVTLTKG